MAGVFATTRGAGARLAWLCCFAIGCGASNDGPQGSGSEGEAEEEAGSAEAGESTAAATEGGSEAGEESGAGSDEGSGDETGVPDDAQKVEFRIESFAVPTQETYYACFEFTLSLDQLGHIVGFAPVIDNAAHVHHFVLTLTDGPTGQAPGSACFDLSGDMIWAWAPGVQEFVLPPEAGYLIGDKPGGQVTFRLQVHYNNPLAVADQVDSSGFDIWVTENLRANDAGTLVFADVAGITIPPGESDYEHIMTCSSAATAATFEKPLNVFASSMHAHEIGKRLWTEVYRDGEMVMELNRDDPFDFNNQTFKLVEAVLEPGDEIVNHCIYDSTDRTETTLGGPGTYDEMCWNTIAYYPKITSGFDYCSSGN